jgi:CheY-like chemotaxis protein
MDALGRLAAGVEHDLNNHLAAIVAFSRLIARRPDLPADLQGDARQLVEEAEGARRLATGLLHFARARPAERHPTAPRALVESVVDLQRPLFAAARIELQVDVPHDLPSVEVERAGIELVLLGLIANAVAAMRSGGTGSELTIVGRQIEGSADRAVRLEVTDTGPGVAPGILDHLDAAAERPPDEADGMGLPIALAIVDAHGGTLSHRPGPNGRGTTFSIELPAATPLAEAPTEAGALPPDGGAARILVLDDEPSIRRVLAKALESAGYRPLLAADEREALAIVSSQPVHAVLCDQRLGGRAGTDAYRAIVDLRPELGRRFVLMSGDVHSPDLEAFAAAHGVGLLAKPFDVAAVTAALAAATDPGRDQSRG